jgi:hypothetical protein
VKFQAEKLLNYSRNGVVLSLISRLNEHNNEKEKLPTRKRLYNSQAVGISEKIEVEILSVRGHNFIHSKYYKKKCRPYHFLATNL